MTSCAGLAEQLGDGDDLESPWRAAPFDQDGKGGHGGGAIAAAIVQKDDGAATVQGRVSMSEICWKTLSAISCGVLRGCSSQSLVSILLPTMT